MSDQKNVSAIHADLCTLSEALVARVLSTAQKERLLAICDGSVGPHPNQSDDVLLSFGLMRVVARVPYPTLIGRYVKAAVQKSGGARRKPHTSLSYRSTTLLP